MYKITKNAKNNIKGVSAMRKKVLQLFRKGNDKKNVPSPENVDICNLNIVSEAEKIIEEYVLKMGLNFKPQKPSPAPLILGIFGALCSLFGVLFIVLGFLKI